MYAFFNLGANSSSKRLLRNVTISAAALICATATPGVFGSQAVATGLSANGSQPHAVWHKMHLKKIGFAAGTSAIYGHSNMLPKTDHFVRPIIKANVIIGSAPWVCTASGLGHRARCGISY